MTDAQKAALAQWVVIIVGTVLATAAAAELFGGWQACLGLGIFMVVFTMITGVMR